MWMLRLLQRVRESTRRTIAYSRAPASSIRKSRRVASSPWSWWPSPDGTVFAISQTFRRSHTLSGVKPRSRLRSHGIRPNTAHSVPAVSPFPGIRRYTRILSAAPGLVDASGCRTTIGWPCEAPTSFLFLPSITATRPTPEARHHLLPERVGLLPCRKGVYRKNALFAKDAPLGMLQTPTRSVARHRCPAPIFFRQPRQERHVSFTRSPPCASPCTNRTSPEMPEPA